jgi:hypothetical protein
LFSFLLFFFVRLCFDLHLGLLLALGHSPRADNPGPCPWSIDDQILFQLGNNNDPFSDDEQVQYINGLRQLLASLRVSEVKDFNAITQAIIDYRSKFRGDPTRILPFGNVDL